MEHRAQATRRRNLWNSRHCNFFLPLFISIQAWHYTGLIISGKRVKHSDSRMQLLAADLMRGFATARCVTSFSFCILWSPSRIDSSGLLFSYRYHLRSYLPYLVNKLCCSKSVAVNCRRSIAAADTSRARKYRFQFQLVSLSTCARVRCFVLPQWKLCYPKRGAHIRVNSREIKLPLLPIIKSAIISSMTSSASWSVILKLVHISRA